MIAALRAEGGSHEPRRHHRHTSYAVGARPVFGLSTTGSTVRTEFVAGLTTFLTMVYIVFVNPQIFGNAGMDKGAVFVATCIAAAVSTLG